ncbi:VOC family protein [Legionella parisiensis]|uniref:Phenazine antibiotic resistance protein EhpR n=1 Tax=Legionella parisiensis TaxID=45071 RepID=A0A1E5JT34_9GAMM|nr:VOC family protein [Legionella parisiensis]KTD40356.1 bleomycin resistance protein [Legionella parisiensis]OEH47694.1 Phenazine antibiotic resistance protein EhpR [Legionella parisiensis]STX77210.1 bleomycin resistance protein [Legionella parisiensis]
MYLDPNLIIFYVDAPLLSASFYEQLFKSHPIESSPTFVMFLLKSGMRLGLWSKHTVEPQATALGGGGELSLQVQNDHVINELYTFWQQQGIQIAQPPTMMDFGYTFVALDPDHHRLRIFSLNPEKSVS